ncbi:MAG: hypothetical protein GY823_08805 [Flavobacteriaceae bacterium]|nr:hypothetical protein [Flavobacteriaceae bacterium]
MANNKNPKLKKNGGEGTFVGNALRWLSKTGTKVAPELLEIAGSITGIEGLSKLGDAIRGDGDLSDSEKELLLREMEYDMIEMVEVTKRLKYDNEHTITRLVRPITYGSMFIMFLSMVFFDGNIGEFTINPLYVPVIQSLFGTMTVFYFGSRGIEKVMKTWKK